MSVMILTEHHLEFLSFKGGCTGSSESTLAKCHIVENHMSRFKILCNSLNMHVQQSISDRPGGYKTFSMLNSAEHGNLSCS